MEEWGGLIFFLILFGIGWFSGIFGEIEKWISSKREAQDLKNREKRIELDEREGRQRGGE